MAQLYLVRHARPVTDAGLPPADWPLSKQGQQDAAGLHRRIDWSCVPFVVSSPELKAVQTAEILASQGHVPLWVHPGLKEISAPWFASQTHLEEEFGQYLAGDDDTMFESWDSATGRFVQAILDITRNVGPQIPVAVSHGRILTAYFSTVFGRRLDVAAWKSLHMPDVCLYDNHARQVISGFFSDV